MKQQVEECGQLVWWSHSILPSTSLLSSSTGITSSSSSFTSSSSGIVSSSSASSVCSVLAAFVVWVEVASVVVATVVNAGIFRCMGTEPELLSQEVEVGSQVVPDGQQCSWSSQQTAYRTKQQEYSSSAEKHLTLVKWKRRDKTKQERKSHFKFQFKHKQLLVLFDFYNLNTFLLVHFHLSKDVESVLGKLVRFICCM